MAVPTGCTGHPERACSQTAKAASAERGKCPGVQQESPPEPHFQSRCLFPGSTRGESRSAATEESAPLPDTSSPASLSAAGSAEGKSPLGLKQTSLKLPWSPACPRPSADGRVTWAPPASLPEDTGQHQDHPHQLCPGPVGGTSLAEHTWKPQLLPVNQS